MKKQFSFLVAIALCLNSFAFSGSGAGTEDDPYIVTTPAQLNEVRNALTAHYCLGADIDLTDWLAANSPISGWEPIGFTGTDDVTNVATFEGSFDGAGHVISGIWINRPNNNFVGLFGQLTGTTSFKNLGLIIAADKSITGKENVGGIAGWLTNITGKDPHRTTVSNCFVSGNIVGKKAVGGLIGLANWNHPIIENCYSTGLISSPNPTELGDGLGGLLGTTWGNVEVNLTHSYSAASLASYATSGSIGGIIGSSSANNPDGIVLNISNNLSVNPAIDAPTAQRIMGWAKSGAHQNFANYAYVGVLLNGQDEWFGYIDNNGGQDVNATTILGSEFYTGIGWDMQDVWKLGNGAYQLPILKSFAAGKQPSAAMAHLPAGENGIATIAIEPNAEINIYDTTGTLVLKNAHEQDVNRLSHGVYILKAGRTTQKFIK